MVRHPQNAGGSSTDRGGSEGGRLSGRRPVRGSSVPDLTFTGFAIFCARPFVTEEGGEV